MVDSTKKSDEEGEVDCSGHSGSVLEVHISQDGDEFFDGLFGGRIAERDPRLDSHDVDIVTALGSDQWVSWSVLLTCSGQRMLA